MVAIVKPKFHSSIKIGGMRYMRGDEVPDGLLTTEEVDFYIDRGIINGTKSNPDLTRAPVAGTIVTKAEDSKPAAAAPAADPVPTAAAPAAESQPEGEAQQRARDAQARAVEAMTRGKKGANKVAGGNDAT